MYHSMKDVLKSCFGEDIDILKQQAVYGGDINEASCLHLSNGERVFMKRNRLENAGFFREEAAGLSAIRQTKAIAVPRIYGYGRDREAGCSFLIMENLDSKGRRSDYWEDFARNLAAMHQADAAGLSSDPDREYGFYEDNYIGANPQLNSSRASWLSFFRDCRLEPQILMAESCLSLGQRKKMQRLLDRLEDLLEEPDQPSLLHGDLWGGNVICGPDGRAWLIDPAVYVGHYEADIAMTQLFGGFPGSFYGAYREILPLDQGYEDRRDLYNLYHLLNHLNLFGRGYLGSVLGILDRYAG